MTSSHWKDGLLKRYKDWRGEKKELEKQITEVTAAYEALQAKHERAEHLAKLIESVEFIMAELAPKWDPSKVSPTKRFSYKLPFEVGAVTRWTLDILREASEPLRSRTIAERIIEMNGMDLEDSDLVERVRVAADATLRSNQKRGLVETVDTWPSRWKIVDHGDRPSASDDTVPRPDAASSG